jgi:pimeloyl-ACP methyl ester carboxylesterase
LILPIDGEGQQVTKISLKEWKSKGTHFIYRGQRVFCREGGQKGAPALLLIHGFPTASWDWEAIWTELSKSYHILTLDMVGFGFSDKPLDYEARQKESGSRPKLLSMCFLNGGLFPEQHRALLSQKILLSPLGPLACHFFTKRAFAANMRKIFANKTAFTPEILDGYWDLRVSGGGLKVLPCLIRYIVERKRHRERWVGALARASIPLKLIVGADDPVSGAHMANHYRKFVGSADVTLLSSNWTLPSG